jgi:hypothetical protein
MTEKELAVSWYRFYEKGFKLTFYWPRALQSLAHRKKFYAEHPDYVKVGRVNHRPIDPENPIPEHCVSIYPIRRRARSRGPQRRIHS